VYLFAIGVVQRGPDVRPTIVARVILLATELHLPANWTVIGSRGTGV